MSFVELLTRRKIRIIEGNAKCRHLKKLACKTYLLYTVSHVGVFDPKNCYPSYLLSGSTLPPSPPACVKVQCVAHGRGWGVLSSVGDHILQEFNTLYLTRFRNYKIARPPQIKNLEGERPQTDKYRPQSPFTGQLFR
jgi:hypothetical protein